MNGIPTRGDPDAALMDMLDEFAERYLLDDACLAVQQDRDAVRVSHSDLYQYNNDIAQDFVDHPKKVLAALRGSVWTMECPVEGMESAFKNLDVRVCDVHTPECLVSELRNEDHKGRYMGVRGQVSLATQVKPQLMNAVFDCRHCGTNAIGPIPQAGEEIQPPNKCPSCERNGPFALNDDKSEYLDHQILELTDPPGEAPGSSGNVVPVHLYGDLAGEVLPGDRIRVNGIVDTEYAELGGGRRIERDRDWLVRGHAIDEEQTAFEEVEPERIEEIESLAERDDIRELLVESFDPDILTGDRGDKHKLAVLLALFGGNSTSGRDDINLFFIGAPGTGKSSYLKRAKELAPKAVEASGKGATAAGLTATATKSETTGKWMLDAGALVLANGGVACIDEFDKMADSARQSMHEAMENQEIPITKAGINTTLTTKTTIIAAANPKNGSFDRWTALTEQVNLGSPLLSRFDLIFGVSDTVHENRDADIARHQHERVGQDKAELQPLEDSLITEYIAYARQHVNPSYASTEPKERLVEYYVDKRQEAAEADDESVTPITPRTNDALRRLAQASARLHLRDEITMEDAEVATELMDMTLGDTALNEDGQITNDKREGYNKTNTQKSRIDRIKKALKQGGDMTDEEIAEELNMPLDKVQHYIQKLKNKGDVYEPKTGVLRWA